jgi:hypothetical protein
LQRIPRAWRLGSAAAAVLVACALPALDAAGGDGTRTRVGPHGTFLVDEVPIFPIVLSKPPPRDGTTPTGGDALDEVVGAGVNFLKVGPATVPWTSADITDANQWDQAAAARGVYTWVNLSTLSQATPGSINDGRLQQVITTLKGDSTGAPGLGMWKGADEPYWGGISPTSLRFAYCRGTSRGDPSWCAGEAALDSAHLWVTIEAPKGTATQLAPYTPVTDTHGVDDYPVTLSNPTTPDLHQVGVWTSTLASITPSGSVWTTLQVCASGSYDASGNFVLPTRRQERYMIYDAIINGARSVGFYGGNNPNCWNATDSAHQWSWTFWDTVLKGLIQEINASSPIEPALLTPASNQVLPSSDSTTQAISRQGGAGSDLWVFAARSGAGSQSVTISGLPAGVTTGSVYTEGRTVTASNGSFTDTFDQWDAHVYHFTSSPTAVVVQGFTARRVPGGVALRWRTGTDAGVAGFEVYRAARRVGRVHVSSSTAAGHRYAFLDAAGRTGDRYRLRMVGLDGRRAAWAGPPVAARPSSRKTPP